MMDRRIDRAKGFGLIELMITLVIASLLLSIAVPAYDRYVDRAKEARAIGDIGAISIEIGKFQLRNNNALPDTLGELGIDIPLDPWDVPYEYLNIVLRVPEHRHGRTRQWCISQRQELEPVEFRFRSLQQR